MTSSSPSQVSFIRRALGDISPLTFRPSRILSPASFMGIVITTGSDRGWEKLLRPTEEGHGFPPSFTSHGRVVLQASFHPAQREYTGEPQDEQNWWNILAPGDIHEIGTYFVPGIPIDHTPCLGEHGSFIWAHREQSGSTFYEPELVSIPSEIVVLQQGI